MTNPVLGAGLHSIGAFSAALCYTPQRKTRQWSWQTYWMAQAAVCWFVLPIVVASISTPHLRSVLHQAPAGAMLRSTALGFCYGIGGTAFGIAIRFIGFSMTYTISVGTSCVLGTLLPPLFAGQLGNLTRRSGSRWVFAGIAIAALGILISGIAGKLRDVDRAQALPADEPRISYLIKGLSIALLAGVLSAVFGLALTAGQPIADVAAQFGAGQFQGNVILIFACGGAFLSTALICLYLHWKHGSMEEYIAFADADRRRLLARNIGLAVLTGMLWYTQFFFYGIAHTYMGIYRFTSWAIHMAMLVLFSMVVGMLLKEWHACQRRTIVVLGSALATLLAAVMVITYGSYLGGG